MPPLVALLLCAAIYTTWKCARLLGRRLGKAYGYAYFVFVGGPLAPLCFRSYRIQEECFAEQRWTAGAMAWSWIMIAGAGVLVASALLHWIVSRREPSV